MELKLSEVTKNVETTYAFEINTGWSNVKIHDGYNGNMPIKFNVEVYFRNKGFDRYTAQYIPKYDEEFTLDELHKRNPLVYFDFINLINTKIQELILLENPPVKPKIVHSEDSFPLVKDNHVS